MRRVRRRRVDALHVAQPPDAVEAGDHLERLLVEGVELLARRRLPAKTVARMNLNLAPRSPLRLW